MFLWPHFEHLGKVGFDKLSQTFLQIYKWLRMGLKKKKKKNRSKDNCEVRGPHTPSDSLSWSKLVTAT